MDKEITLENFKEIIKEYFDYSKTKMGFTLPIGKIGNTDVYRISDQCITGKGGWELFEDALRREAFKDNPKVYKYPSNQALLKKFFPSRKESIIWQPLYEKVLAEEFNKEFEEGFMKFLWNNNKNIN